MACWDGREVAHFAGDPGIEGRRLVSKARGTAVVLRWQSKPLLMATTEEAL